MYLCRDCGRQFQDGLRINNISLWNDYLTANRTIPDLSTLHKCSERTIRRRLSLVVDSFTATCPKSAVIIMDTTYFSKTFVQERNHDHSTVLPFWLFPQLQALLPLLYQGTSGKLLPYGGFLHAFRGTHAPRVLRPDGLHAHPRFWKVHGH